MHPGFPRVANLSRIKRPSFGVNILPERNLDRRTLTRVLGESTIADAIIDRPAHTPHIVELKGGSRPFSLSLCRSMGYRDCIDRSLGQ